MLRIQNATGQTLQLDDTDIEIELNNWLLADSDDLPGSYSYPISFPLSDPNIKFLKHKHLPETRPEPVPVTVWINGIMLRKSTLSYKIQKKQASGYLKVDAGELAAKIKGVYLYEVLQEKVYLYGTSAMTGPDTNSAERKQQIVAQKMLDIAKAEPGEYPITFFPVFNVGFSPEEFEGEGSGNYSYNRFVNPWFQGSFLVDTGGKYGNHGVPFIYLTHILKSICTFFGYTASGSFFNDSEVIRWVVYNTQTLSSTNIITTQGLYADLGRHVPYMTISDFLKALRDDLGLGIYFNSTTLDAKFELYDSIVDSSKTPVDLTPYILAGYSSDIPAEKGYSVVSYQDDMDATFKEYTPVTTKIKDGQKDVKSQIGTLQMVRDFNVQNGIREFEWSIPTANQPGNLASIFYRNQREFYNAANEHKNEFGLRILSYRGMQPASNGGLYPYGTALSTNWGQEKIGTWSLDPKQQDSIYQKITVPFYYFLANAKRLDYELLIPISKAKDIKLHNIYSLKGENRGLVKFLIEQFTFSAPGNHGLLPAKLKACILVAQEAVPNRLVGEVYYVEMIIDNIRTVSGDGYELTYEDITFRVWADAHKTIPANPTDLIIRYESFNSAGSGGMINNSTQLVSGHEYFMFDMLIQDSTQGFFMEFRLAFSDDYYMIQ